MRPNRPFAHTLRRVALAALLLAPLLAVPAAPGASQGVAPSTGQGVQVGLEGARLVDFIRFLGQFLGGSPVLREDHVPPASVSVVAPEPLGPGELRALLDLVLKPAGLEAVLRGGVSYVLPAAAPGPPLPEDAQILVWSLPRGEAQARSLAGVLERLRSDRGRVLSSGRLVALADEAPRVARLRPVLQALAALPPGRFPEIVPLARAQARQTARALELRLKSAQGGGSAPLLVLPLDWSNSLLLAGTPEDLERARALVEQIDGAGPDAPVLKAYRTRHVRPDKVLAALRERLAAGGAPGEGAETPRLSLDQDGQAVLALAPPELLARLDRLVEDLDQPRPRVYIEALVAEFSPAALAGLALSGQPSAGSTGADGAAQASGVQVGSAVALHGRVADAAQLGMEAVSALWATVEGVRVLAVPRLAVLEGAEATVSGGQLQAGGERFRLTIAPRLEPGQGGAAGRVLLRLTLDDVQPAGPQSAGVRQDSPGGARTVEVALAQGQVLLLGAPGQGDRPAGGWTLFSPSRKAEGPGRLVVLASARVVRPAASDRGPGPGGGAGGRNARDK